MASYHSSGTHGAVSPCLASTALLCGTGSFTWLANWNGSLPVNAKFFRYLITPVTLGLAIWAGFSLYSRYVEHPWTRDGQVRANIVGIAPRVSGPIIRVAVVDNQPVREGELLFEIDPSDFQAEVDIAAGQVRTDKATLEQQQQNLERQTELYRTRVNTTQDFQNAQDAFAAANAELASAEARLELAKLKLGYTKVLAPVTGYVTNMNVSPGTYVRAGVELIAVVDSSSYWIAGYFKENQLPHIRVGQEASITMIGYERQPFPGVVRSVGWGVYIPDGSDNVSSGVLPEISPTIDWIRLPQRFAVRIEVAGDTPVPLRIGQTVSVAVTGAF